MIKQPFWRDKPHLNTGTIPKANAALYREDLIALTHAIEPSSIVYAELPPQGKANTLPHVPEGQKLQDLPPSSDPKNASVSLQTEAQPTLPYRLSHQQRWSFPI
jgi:hypothetical protein